MIAMRSRPWSSWPNPGMKKLASAAMTFPVEPCPVMSSLFLGQLVAQDERVLHAVPNRRGAFASETVQFSGGGARHYGIGLLCLAVLEYPGALEHKRAFLSPDASGDPLEPDERRRPVAAVHHEVVDLPFPVDVAGEGLLHGGPRELRKIGALAVGLFIPALDGEPGIRGLLHAATPHPHGSGGCGGFGGRGSGAGSRGSGGLGLGGLG